jgi:fructuronate reductase
MREEAAPTIAVTSGQDLGAYADALLERFSNSGLAHRLSQIAMDGSEKLPQRWLETLAANQLMGRRCPAILAGIASWIAHLRGANGPVHDPRADVLAAAVRGPDAFAALFGAAGLLASPWAPEAADAVAGGAAHK